MKLKLGTAYKVVWYDAYNHGPWRDISKSREEGPCACVTVGVYVGDTKAGDMMFAGSYGLDPTDTTTGSTAMRPKNMIKKITELKEGRVIYGKKSKSKK